MEKAKILIVEHEAITAMEIQNSLKNLGYQITSIVNTGEQAIDKAVQDKPDIILMDIRTKGEMDGVEAARILKSRFELPVILSAVCPDEERIEQADITMPFG